MSRVRNFYSTFNEALAFNQALNNWDVANVHSVYDVQNGNCFHCPIGSWNVAKVTDMKHTFSRQRSSITLGAWVEGHIDRIRFQWSYSFNHPLNEWDVKSDVIHGGSISRQLFQTACDGELGLEGITS